MLGAGMMGAGIAYVSARGRHRGGAAGHRQEAPRRARLFGRAAGQGHRARQGSAGKAEACSAASPTTDYADLAGCELVIEAVFENRDIKADVTAQDRGGDPEARSSPATPRRCRSPAWRGLETAGAVHRHALLLAGGQDAAGRGHRRRADLDEAAIAAALDYVQQIRKTPIVVNDSRGFYTSRVFGTFTRGHRDAGRGREPALIENAAKMAGMPVGPLAVSDEVTLELATRSCKQTRKDLGDAYRLTPADAGDRKFHDELDRSASASARASTSIPRAAGSTCGRGSRKSIPLAGEQPDVEELKKRLLYIQALETARCLEEGVLTDPEDADIGSIFGWGFPPWTGGTASVHRHRGHGRVPGRLRRLADAVGKHYRRRKWLRNREQHALRDQKGEGSDERDRPLRTSRAGGHRDHEPAPRC
jgi:3-hydroxyacyl-CoA dehydrogenase / enoyl-CoA hydratase / 3-hydroxybutyryl-CoA epimerase